MATDFLAGKNGNVTVNANNVNIEEWNVSDTTSEEETTHSGSGGFMEGIAAIRSASGSFKGTWDANATPFDSPPALLPSTFVDNLILNFNGTKKWTFPKAFIQTVDVTNNVRGKIEWTCTFRSDGTFTRPGE